jgi:hypothetical protein
VDLSQCAALIAQGELKVNVLMLPGLLGVYQMLAPQHLSAACAFHSAGAMHWLLGVHAIQMNLFAA